MLRIDHIGSTSVPGLAAKDVIDVQVTVRALADARYALLFRDYLRAHTAAADAYTALKRGLAAAIHGRGTYAEVKDPFCDLIWIAAEEWAAATGWNV